MSIWIVLGIAVAVVLFVALTYNALVTLRQECKNAFADIDVYLKQRFDLIPNLVETVKGYAAHEKSVFEAIAKARAGISSASTLSERVQAENSLGTAMRGFYAVMENYPQLKANETFMRLMAELSDIENKVSAARRFFNNAVAEYNGATQHVPAVFFARNLGFLPETFFDLGEDERRNLSVAPKVGSG